MASNSEFDQLKKTVILAIRENPRTYTSDTVVLDLQGLNDDDEISVNAIVNDPSSIQYLSPRLQSHFKLLARIFESCYFDNVLCYVPRLDFYQIQYFVGRLQQFDRTLPDINDHYKMYYDIFIKTLFSIVVLQQYTDIEDLCYSDITKRIKEVMFDYRNFMLICKKITNNKNLSNLCSHTIDNISALREYLFPDFCIIAYNLDNLVLLAKEICYDKKGEMKDLNFDGTQNYSTSTFFPSPRLRKYSF